MNELIDKLLKESREEAFTSGNPKDMLFSQAWGEKFAEKVIKECIDSIETYRIPVGNSAAGEMACEWTYDALKEIRDEIKEKFGVK